MTTNGNATCPVDHEAAKTDPDRWAALALVGTQPTYDEPGQPDALELRNCACGTTLARPFYTGAQFNPPPSVVDEPLPRIRWAARDEYSRDGELLVDVLHYVQVDGRWESRSSCVEATRDYFYGFTFYAVSGDDLDDASEKLLCGDLLRDERGKRPTFRIDPLDLAMERLRMTVEAHQEAA